MKKKGKIGYPLKESTSFWVLIRCKETLKTHLQLFSSFLPVEHRSYKLSEKTQGIVHQVLKQVVNLSCFICNIKKMQK